MSMVELTHGGVITRGAGSLDIFISYRDVPKGKDQPLHEAVKDPNSGISEPGGIIETFPSSRVNNVKRWTKRRINFPDGSFVRFTVRKTTSGGITAFKQGLYNFIISPRESAPLQEIRIDLPSDKNSNTSAVYVTGRFDIMMPKEIMERRLNMGDGGNNDMSTYDLAALDEVISLRTLEKGTRARVQAKMVRNKLAGVTVARIRKPRRINLPTR